MTSRSMSNLVSFILIGLRDFSCRGGYTNPKIDYTGPQPSEAPGVEHFYYKKGGFIIKTSKKAIFKKRGRLWAKKKCPCQECPGAEHIGWIFPTISHPFPTILYIVPFILMDFQYISLFAYNCSLIFTYF